MEGQRAGLLEAMMADYREACESEKSVKRALDVVCGERDQYWQVLVTVEDACAQIPEEFSRAIRACLAA